MNRRLRIAVVAGEESGDLLGADLIAALKVATGQEVELVGVGGRHLEALGLASLFESSDIALMGVLAVLRDLPRLLRRISQTADAIVRAKPDCLVTIDSPDFSLRVARKVRSANPAIPIVHYVCPSVWAWRPGRAPAMRSHVDRILCVLPFEPAVLERLKGPPGTYVGHRLSTHEGVIAAAAAREAQACASTAQPRKLLVLPGSRRSEVSRLLQPFGEVVRELAERGNSFEVIIPTVPNVASFVEVATSRWAVRPVHIHDEAGKWRAFGQADAALAASGTVLLELALARVPMVSCYRTDPLIGSLIRRLLTVWSAALPNLIADWPVVREFYDDMLHPAHVARLLERLMADTAMRDAQLEGFDEIARRMETPLPSGLLAAQAVIRELRI